MHFSSHRRRPDFVLNRDAGNRDSALDTIKSLLSSVFPLATIGYIDLAVTAVGTLGSIKDASVALQACLPPAIRVLFWGWIFRTGMFLSVLTRLYAHTSSLVGTLARPQSLF